MDCPYLVNHKDGTLFSYNTYTCRLTGQQIKYDSNQMERVCGSSNHDECPLYKKAR